MMIDTTRAGQQRYAMPEQDRQTDWHAMWVQRGDRLMKLAEELEETKHQRDMLARRCAEQANHIAGLLELQAEEAAEAAAPSVADAIAVMQKQGVR